jgi:hypothetical protein
VATRRWILMLSAAATISFLAGCGGSTFNVQNPPPPPPSQVMIAWQSQPGPLLAVGGTVTASATVTNDPNNLGVDWTLSCPAGITFCGTLSLSNTASGGSTTYTAPSSISGNTLNVQIVAEAIADPTKNLVAPITITTFDSGLQAGNYVLQAQGSENGSPYQFAGVITLDGQGNITGGEQTANPNGVSTSGTVLASGSSYFIGNDGRGTITLNTGDNSIGGNGLETFAFVFLNNGPQNPQALISQIDFAAANTGASAAGTMQLQQTGFAAPAGSYAFVLNGADVADSSFPLAFGGVLNIPSGQTAISGVVDEVIGEKIKLSDGTFLTGSQVSAPDKLGKVTFTLSGVLDGVHPKTVTAAVTGYIVDASYIALIESDTDPASGVTPLGMTGGIALGQVSGDFGNFTDSSLSGPYVFGVTGVDLWQSNLTPTTWTLAGVTTADGQGNLSSGFMDSFLQLNCNQSTCKTVQPITGAQISAQFTGTYAVDSASGNCGATSGSVVPGTGRACLTPSTFTPTPNPTYSPELFFYLTGLTGAGDPAALVLGVGNIGPSPNLHYPSLGTGIAYVQSSAVATFSGTYGMSFTQENGSENDGTAQMTVNPTGTPQISGAADSTTTTPDDVTLTDHAFTGSFAGPQSATAFAGGIFDAVPDNVPNSGPFNVAPNDTNNGFSVDYFYIDAEHGFFVETDLINPSPGSGQVSFGYYAGLTPVCQVCQLSSDRQKRPIRKASR